jgi:hypothetical protein
MNPGDVVAERFEIQALAGSGGMGFVYRARDRATGELVALKMLRGERATDADRFAREALLLSGLRHPGIVRYLDHGTTDSGAQFLAMEWLVGENLADRLARGPVSIHDSIVLLERTAEALGFAHQRGIVHRDLKPSNIFLCDGVIDRVKLLDFGIARRPHEEQLLTRTGAMLGTPGYMSPEQARGSREVDARSDVFSLGCVLFKCLTGRAPFEGQDALTVLVKVMLEEVPPVGMLREDVPEGLEVLLSQMLAKTPVGRPRDAAAVAEELRQLESLGDRPSALPNQPLSLTTREERVTSMVLVAPPLPLRVESVTNRDEREHPVHAAVREAVERLGGEVEVLADGSILVTTGATGVATDEAARAARCALAVQSLVPQARIALVAGSRATSSRAPIGRSIEQGVELLRREGGHLVRIDDAVAGLLDVRFDVGGDEHGLVLRSEIKTLDGARTLLGRPSPCVGRERELSVLETIYDDCLSESRACAALVMAPTGVGKSRLRHEFVARLQARSGRPEVWAARADPLGVGSAFGLIAQAVRRASGLHEGEPAAVARQKLRAHVSRRIRGEALERVTQFLAELVGVPFPEHQSPQLDAARQNPALMGDQLRLAFEEFLAATCAELPVLIVLEDLQWGDLPSVKLIDAVLRDLAGSPLMVLALARPEVREVFPRLWEERSPQQVRLGELSRKAAEKLVRDMLTEADDETVARIVTQASGNALYLEELIRAEAEGRGEVLPGSVLAMVQARIESLETEARRVLRAASIFGDVFWRGGVLALVGGAREAQMSAWLKELVAREIIAERPLGKFPKEETYAFRHTIVREAAYAMLTERDRKVGHRLAGEWLEQAGESDPMVLAEHFDRGEARARAAHWFERAAAAAFDANDFAGAIARVQSGLACEPRGEIRGALKLLECRAHGNRGDAPAAEAVAREAMRELPKESAPWFEAARVLAIATASLGQDDRLAQLARDLLEQPFGANVALAQLRTWAVTARSLANAGLFPLCDQLLARIGEVPIPDDLLVAAAIADARGLRAYHAGDLYQYLQSFTVAMETELAAGDRRGAEATAIDVAFALAELGDLEEAERRLRRACEELEPIGLAGHVASASAFLGYVQALRGAREEGCARLERALRSLGAMGHARAMGQARALLARARYESGDPEGALTEAQLLSDDQRCPPMLRAQALAIVARSSLAAGRAADALAAATAAMRIVDALGAIGSGESSARLAYAEALRATGDRPGSVRAIATAHDRLLARAARIGDPRLRESFLRRGLDNARTLALVDQWI